MVASLHGSQFPAASLAVPLGRIIRRPTLRTLERLVLFLDTQREYPVQLGELRVERGLLLYETSELFIPGSPDLLPLLVGVLAHCRSQLGFLARFALL